MNANNLQQRQCSVEGCDKRHFCRGMCQKHHRRWYRTGSTFFEKKKKKITRIPFMSLSCEEQKRILLEKREIKENGCWESTEPPLKTGYCRLRGQSVHRLSAYLWLRFDLKSPLHICHHCDNRICFNPDHLFIGTHADNMKDRDDKGRCAKGEKHKCCKLTESSVVEIRKRNRLGETKASLAREYMVSESCIQNIAKNRTWKHII